jgi:hypothetical protein
MLGYAKRNELKNLWRDIIYLKYQTVKIIIAVEQFVHHWHQQF